MPVKHLTGSSVSNGFTSLLFLLIFCTTTNVFVFGEKDLAVSGEYNNNNSQNFIDTAITTPEPQPIFDFGMPRNISARTGQAALIKCRVDNLGDKSISWIRKRDLHILTVGTSTYTSDERFQVTQTQDSKEWTLQVKFPQPRDSGIYECQVNTEPKISMAFQLSVLVTPPHAKAAIAGPPDLHFKVGSSIILTCIVKQPLISTKLAGQIHWYRGDAILTPFNTHPNEAFANLSQRISMESQLGDTLKSRLRISNAQTLDTGNYTCLPTTASSASVMVHVINDEKPAAMQKSKGNSLWNLWFMANIINIIELLIYFLL
ncbi:zwei Ig domain protein zig-8-like [Episyrphus balteatus]|uniref:zwei Ig domain protein zig-8-like n=1 Tax=Episyrphus balteatus TaxID=286459 RepID=UPI0024856C74|nr:zwei Ig domain protein zig-8-like [Episyrphus balteatus]